ncbi:MAG TPA: sigma-70 family RNA polymerase sigma factor [Candidatus Didemnitutus sp.]|nr:sigma-70 family RNA polymerase sigma factor [Candidatus Didemnitutus sp.]
MASSGILTREKILEIARTLPAAPQVFASLDRLLGDTNSPLDQIAELIKRDAALAAHIIRISNSAALGGEQRAGSVEEAVGRVGYEEIYRLVGYIASAQLAERALKHYGVEATQLHEHMVHTAFVCEQLAIECGLDARTAYTCGLMRPIGLFVCDQVAGLYDPVEVYHPLRDRDYLSWEGRIFGIGSCDVAAMVLLEWKFPEDIVSAVRNQYSPTVEEGGHKLTCLLNLASGLVANDGQGLLGETRHWVATQRKLDLLGLTEKRLQAAGVRAREAFFGFQRRLEKTAPKAPDKQETDMPGGPGGALSPDSCDFLVQVRVVQKNNETPVPPPKAEVTPPPDFTTFMRNYQDMVYSTAVRLIGNETQAEDIAQEVFIKAHEHFGNLRTSPTAGGWLKTVATNLSINHIQRYKKRWSFFSDLVHRDDEGGEKEVEFAAPDTFFSNVDSSERREWVEGALEKLPAHQRVPLVLFHFEDMPYEDIARKTGVSLSKVKTDILRGREALAKILMRSGTTHEKFTK